MSLNKVLLIGNVGRDPEVRYLEGNGAAGNTKVATFTLATTERYRDRNSGETRESTEWHNIVAWRQSADIAEKYIHKGSQIFIEGRLRTRSYTDQSGVKKYTTEITVDNLQLLGRRQDDGQNGGYQPPFQPQNGDGQRNSQYGGYQQGGYQRSNGQGSYQSAAMQQGPAKQAGGPIDLNLDDAGSDDLPF